MPAHPVPARGFARTSIRLLRASIVSSLVVAEVSNEPDATVDQHVGPLGGTDMVTFPTGMWTLNSIGWLINGDTILSPSFGVSSVRHDHSSQSWWVPRSGARRAAVERPITQR